MKTGALKWLHRQEPLIAVRVCRHAQHDFERLTIVSRQARLLEQRVFERDSEFFE